MVGRGAAQKAVNEQSISMGRRRDRRSFDPLRPAIEPCGKVFIGACQPGSFGGFAGLIQLSKLKACQVRELLALKNSGTCAECLLKFDNEMPGRVQRLELCTCYIRWIIYQDNNAAPRIFQQRDR